MAILKQQRKSDKAPLTLSLSQGEREPSNIRCGYFRRALSPRGEGQGEGGTL